MNTLVIPAAQMSGAPLDEVDWFENYFMPDPIMTRALLPGRSVEMEFDFDQTKMTKRYVELTLVGLAGSFRHAASREIYEARVPMTFHFRITLNGQEVYTDPLFYRNHFVSDPRQRTALKFEPEKLPLKKGRNVLTIENHTPPGRFSHMEEYFIASVEIGETTGRLINKLYQPDALDLYIDQHPQPDFLNGAGYELIVNRDIPAMIQDIVDDRIGNYLMIRPDTALNDGTLAHPEEILGWVRQLVANRIYFSIMIFRAKGHPINDALAAQIEKIAGEYFVSFNHHEIGLILGGSGKWREGFMTGASQDLKEAFDTYIDIIRRRTAMEFPKTTRPLGNSELYFYSDANIRAGIDIPLAETLITHDGVLIASVRGATRAHGKTRWGVHKALLWSLGNGIHYGWDDAKAERYRLAVKLSYFAGARIIYPESGLFRIMATHMPAASRKYLDENTASADSPVQQRVRHAHREVRRMHAVHQLPSDPRTDIALLQGNLDPFTGRVRGMKPFMNSNALTDHEADSGWELLRTLFTDLRVFFDEQCTKADKWFSGTPYGPSDIVPATAPAKNLARYKVAALAGWNSMTPEMYREWKKYVAGGGTLVVSAPQLRTDLKPGDARSIVNAGDVRDLFGVRLGRIGHEVLNVAGRLPSGAYQRQLVIKNQRLVDPQELQVLHTMRCEPDKTARVLLRSTTTGEPLLVEKRIGKGRAYLFTVWEYPGHPKAMPIVKDLLRQLIEGIKRPVQISAPATVAHFTYRDGNTDIIAAIDTDWTSAAKAKPITITAGKSQATFDVPPHAARFIYHRAGTFVAPRSELCGVRFRRGKGKLELMGFGEHEIEMVLPGGRIRRVTINESNAPVRTVGKSGMIRTKCQLDGPTRVEIEKALH